MKSICKSGSNLLYSQQKEKDFFDDVAKALETVTEIQSRKLKSLNLTDEDSKPKKRTLSEIHSVS